uniref:CUB domain-containing protein n=1 Tax=Panagrolaimus sp. JU765 TaxID=591449 RepID=A0AC34QNG0_9BILA
MLENIFSCFLLLGCFWHLTGAHPLYRKGGEVHSGLDPLKPDQNIACPSIETINNTAGHIYSPNFPGQYPANSACEYTITGPEGTVIILAFYVFETESEYDLVKLFDGTISDAEPFAILSGNLTTNVTYSSNSPKMTVRFETDAFTNYQGFYATYVASTNIRADPTGDICPDQVYTDSFGVIVSPHFPAQYPPSVYCNYQIGTGQEGTIVRFTVYSFQTEGIYDVVGIYDGKDNTSSLIIELSGGVFQGSTYETTQPYAYASFSTDTYTEEAGFSIIYQVLPASDADSTAPVQPIDFPMRGFVRVATDFYPECFINSNNCRIWAFQVMELMALWYKNN